MNPKIWGPHAWIFLHSITLNDPKNPTLEQKEQYKNFFLNLQHVIPCEKCAYNYKQKLKKNPIKLDNKKMLIEWLIEIHNDINKSHNKPTITYKEFINYYNKLYTSIPINNNNKISNNNNKIYVYLLYLIVFLILLSFFKNN